MKVKVNRESCISCGACQVIAPELFELDDEGISLVKVEEVSKEEEDNARDASESCPTMAIEIEE